jgi:hypothetical protein
MEEKIAITKDDKFSEIVTDPKNHYTDAEGRHWVRNGSNAKPWTYTDSEGRKFITRNPKKSVASCSSKQNACDNKDAKERLSKPVVVDEIEVAKQPKYESSYDKIMRKANEKKTKEQISIIPEIKVPLAKERTERQTIEKAIKKAKAAKAKVEAKTEAEATKARQERLKTASPLEALFEDYDVPKEERDYFTNPKYEYTYDYIKGRLEENAREEGFVPFSKRNLPKYTVEQLKPLESQELSPKLGKWKQKNKEGCINEDTFGKRESRATND